MQDWMPGIDEASTEGGEALREGSVLIFRAHGAPHRSEVAVFEPDSTMTLVARQGGFTARYTYALSPEGPDSYRFSLDLACRGSGLMALAAPILDLIARRTDRAQIARFKAVASSATQTE